MVFRGKRRNTEPLLNIRMSTPEEGEDIDLFYIEYKAPTLTYGEANHYWCGCLFRTKVSYAFSGRPQ